MAYSADRSAGHVHPVCNRERRSRISRRKESPVAPPSLRMSVNIRDDEREVIQQRMPLVTEQIQMQQGGIVGIPMEYGAIDADGMVVDPSVVRVEVKSIPRALTRRRRHDVFVGFEEAGVAETERCPPAAIVLARIDSR